MFGGLLLTADLLGVGSIIVLAMRGYGLILLFQKKSSRWFAHKTISK